METNFSKCILSIDEDEGEEIALRRANNIVGKLFPRTRSKRITKAPLCFRDQSPPRYCRDDTIPSAQPLDIWPRIRTRGMKSYLDSDSAEIFPSPPRLGESRSSAARVFPRD